MRPLLLLGLLLAGCVPDAKSNKCAYWGELSGSVACTMSNASFDSAANRTRMTLESLLRPADSALIKVTIEVEGAPVVGERSLPTIVGYDLGCNVWFFHQQPPAGDNARDAQTFGGDERVPCKLKLTEVVALDETSFTVRGNIESGVEGGKSVQSPLRRASLAAGF